MRWRELISALLLLLSVGDLDIVHAQTSNVPDLAAITFRPSDLDLSTWTHEGAFFEAVRGFATSQANYAGGDGESIEQQLREIGWVQMFVSTEILTGIGSAARPEQRLRSYVTEYQTAEGAAAGFSMLEDESVIDTAEDVPTSRTFGEQSELTRDRGIAASSGRPYSSLDLTMRVGNLVAGVTQIDYLTASTVKPDLTTIESLGSILESRLNTPPIEPGISNRMARLPLGDDTTVTFDDAYYRLDSSDFKLSSETSIQMSSRTATYSSALDGYQLWQGIASASGGEWLYGETVLRFASSEAAAQWVSSVDEILGANSFYGDLQVAHEMTPMGDQSTAFSYVSGGGSTGPRAVLVAVRVGAEVARVHVVPQGDAGSAPIDGVVSLAEQATAALSGTPPALPAEIPDELRNPVPLATPAAS